MGDENGNFRADAGITRAEVVVLFSRLLKNPMPSGLKLTSKFGDVPQDKWYFTSVAYMEQFGIVSGYEDGTFRPEDTISRSELVAIASRFSQLELTNKQFYSDVPEDHWAALYINSAKLKGWVSGYADGTFKPNQGITRGETVSLVNAFLGREPDKKFIDAHASELKSFSDVSKSYWGYYEIVEATNGHKHNGKNPESWTAIK